MAPTRVAGDLYIDIDGQMWEIKRQLRQKEGYPYDPMQLVEHLQAAIEGNLVDRCGQLFSKKISSQLLKPIGTVAVPATTQPFVVKDEFVVNTSPEALVKISFMGSNFREWFLGKTEEPTAGTTLCYAKLVNPSVDGPILAELGDKAETTLTQIYALMECQPNGEGGVLLTNERANIFYARDVNGSLRAVYVDWPGVGWLAGAHSVGLPDKWRDGHRVFSRNS